MTRTFIRVDINWALELKSTLEEYLALVYEDCNLKDIYSFCTDYCMLMHNFILDNDNVKFNTQIKGLESRYSTKSIDIGTIQYYQRRLYFNVRSGLNSLNLQIISITPLINEEELLYAMVVDYEKPNLC